MKKPLFLLLPVACYMLHAQAQNVGIGTQAPKARLHVLDSSVLFSATLDVSESDNLPMTGAGTRMMWYPGKGAFRTGHVDGVQWDKSYMGLFSFAAGRNVIASGESAVALGRSTQATNSSATAMGFSTRAYGVSSTAMGDGTLASEENATAMGYQSAATGNTSTAIGFQSTASGQYATAIGVVATASGVGSTAMGWFTTAAGPYSTAIGTYASTGNNEGALVIGDHSTTTLLPGISNMFRARFSAGYRFFTNSIMTVSCALPAGANAWNTGSDVKLKENFEDVNGESFLQKIAAMHLSSWNYKSQDPKTFRHYGPIAQEFFAAFGKDKIGTIGCDTLINQADFDGVNLIAIQALEKRTQRIDLVEKENAELKNEVAELTARLKRLEASLLKK